MDRLIPLTDVVTANFSIAPIAINTKLEPILISRSHHGVRGHFKVTRAASHTRLSREGPAEAMCSAPTSRSDRFVCPRCSRLTRTRSRKGERNLR